jgi:hypothetical protein
MARRVAHDWRKGLRQIYRWNGTVWKPTRLPLSNVYINDVAVISDNQVMADGFGSIGELESFLWTDSPWRAVPVPSASGTLILYWNGKTWS